MIKLHTHSVSQLCCLSAAEVDILVVGECISKLSRISLKVYDKGS